MLAVFILTYLLCQFLIPASSDLLDGEWTQWKKKYGKNFDDEEEETTRFNVWKINRAKVEEHNALYRKGDRTFMMEMNALAAMTEAEFRELLEPNGPAALLDGSSDDHFADFSGRPNLPASVNWTERGYVTPVKDQGKLGSCYAFSAIGCVEGQYRNQTGKLINLSEQQIVDCDQGGDGGFAHKVYQYLIKVGGSMSESSYPYVGKVGTCKFKSSEVVATLSSYKFVRPVGNEEALKAAVAEVGPISIGHIKVFNSLQLYRPGSGIYYEPQCNDPSARPLGYHAMLATGYGTQNGQDYWIVKNCWHADWGMGGYVLMSRNRGNNCGIASRASFPIMSKDGSKSSATSTDPATATLSVTFLLIAAMYL